VMSYASSRHARYQSLDFAQRLHDWLSPADLPRTADLIFVLAGRMNRKSYALELFHQRLASRILFSVARFEIRRFSNMALPTSFNLLKLAQDVPPAARHFFVLFENDEVVLEHIRPRRFGTLTEISALARWLQERVHISSLMIISSDTHLRRVRLCCRALLDPTLEVNFVASPETGSTVEPRKSRSVSIARDLLELSKLLLYGCVLKFTAHRFSEAKRRTLLSSESKPKDKIRH